ncbi:hypothetical protein [Citrobacter amalonaticus]|uniref:hypothetical protein n=1 Tax=Citrobacter amalonaticus TaxID=35703 RepID=UPI00300D54F3
MWREIDTNKRLWAIPAEKMKMKREHQVSLSPQALTVLVQLKLPSEYSQYASPDRVKRSQPIQRPRKTAGRFTANSMAALNINIIISQIKHNDLMNIK